MMTKRVILPIKLLEAESIFISYFVVLRFISIQQQRKIRTSKAKDNN